MKPLDPNLYKRSINPDTKAVTYWARQPVFFTNQDLLDFEREMEHYHCNGRVCLHSDQSALLHDMIIFEWSQRYFPVHKHPMKSETITPLRNFVRLTVYSEVDKHYMYTVNESAIYTIPANTYHQITTASPYAIYRETKLGPFMGEADREFLDGRK